MLSTPIVCAEQVVAWKNMGVGARIFPCEGFFVGAKQWVDFKTHQSLRARSQCKSEHIVVIRRIFSTALGILMRIANSTKRGTYAPNMVNYMPLQRPFWRSGKS